MPPSLAARVADFWSSSLDDGVPVVTISRPAHRDAVDELLAATRAVDVDRARRDGAPDHARRRRVDGPLPGRRAPRPRPVRRLRRRPRADGGPATRERLRRDGRLLWERGEVAAALELESLWNTADRDDTRSGCSAPIPGPARRRRARRRGDGCAGSTTTSAWPGRSPVSGATTADGDVVRSSVYLPVPAAVGSVRGFVRDALAGWGLDHLVSDAVLITSELATNAVTHASSPFRTSLVRTGDVVRVSVEDGSSAWPRDPPRPAGRPGRPRHGHRLGPLAPHGL